MDPTADPTIQILWVAAAAVPDAAIQQAEAWLRPDEIQRIGRLVMPGAARLSRIGRALARRSLASRTGTDPADWIFELGPHGKPSPRHAADPELRAPSFNLSHCSDLVALALSDGLPIGVDVESTGRRVPELRPERFFAPEEVAQLASSADDDMFWRLWTAKEAWLKARGTGIAGTLTSFAIGLGPPPSLLWGPTDEPPGAWALAEFRPTPGHRLAVAVRCPNARPEWHFEPASLD